MRYVQINLCLPRSEWPFGLWTYCEAETKKEIPQKSQYQTGLPKNNSSAKFVRKWKTFYKAEKNYSFQCVKFSRDPRGGEQKTLWVGGAGTHFN